MHSPTAQTPSQVVRGLVHPAGERSPTAKPRIAHLGFHLALLRAELGLRLALSALGCTTAAGCWENPTSAFDPIPVVSLTLVEGDSLQVASVSITTPGDSAIPHQGIPLPPDSVDLQVADDSGHVWPLVPSTTPGRFTVAMALRRGARYELRGAVMGRAVAAENRAPAEFAMTRPAGDTITVADTAPCEEPYSLFANVCVPVSLVVEAGGTVLCVLTQPGASRDPFCSVSGDQLRLESRSDSVRDLVVFAYYPGPGIALDYERGVLVTFPLMLVIRRKLYTP